MQDSFKRSVFPLFIALKKSLIVVCIPLHSDEATVATGSFMQSSLTVTAKVDADDIQVLLIKRVSYLQYRFG